MAVQKLEAHYPASSERLNRELSQLLLYLEAPGAISKTLDLMDGAKTQEEQINCIFQLRNLKSGWTLDQRRKYFDWYTKIRQGGKGEVTYPAGAPYNVWTNQARARRVHPPELVQWFKEVDRDYGDGASFTKFLINIRKDAIAKLTSAERTALRPLIEQRLDAPRWKPTRDRQFVKEWMASVSRECRMSLPRMRRRAKYLPDGTERTGFADGVFTRRPRH